MSDAPRKRWALPQVHPDHRRKMIGQPAGAATSAYCKSCQPFSPAPAAPAPHVGDTSAQAPLTVRQPH